MLATTAAGDGARGHLERAVAVLERLATTGEEAQRAQALDVLLDARRLPGAAQALTRLAAGGAGDLTERLREDLAE